MGQGRDSGSGAAHVEVHREVAVPVAARCFEGHYPGDPIMPAASQLDLLVLPAIGAALPELGTLAAARALRFRAPVRPGDRLALTLRVRRTRAACTDVRFTLTGPAGPCASGTLCFAREEIG